MRRAAPYPVRLPADLRDLLRRVALRTGKSAHSLVLATLRQSIRRRAKRLGIVLVPGTDRRALVNVLGDES